MSLYLLGDIKNVCFEKMTLQNLKDLCTKHDGQNC